MVSMSLTIRKDLVAVNSKIQSASGKWYFIGLELGIDAGELESIRGEQRGIAIIV